MTFPLRALIFDLDDTLLVDEAVSKEVLAEITAPLALARIFHTHRDEEVAKADEARRKQILTQGCMSTYCSSHNLVLTQHSSGFPASTVDGYEICGLACCLDSKMVVEKTIAIARQLWSEGPCYSFCRSIGISPLECLWGNFLGESTELRALRTWSLEYRREVFKKVLSSQIFREAKLPSKRVSPTIRDCIYELVGTDPIAYDKTSFASSPEKMAADFAALRRARQCLFPETFSLIEKLSRHYKLGLLTNGAPDLQREKIAASGLDAFFSAIVISGEHGIGKPDPAIFHLLLKQLDVKPEEALMIGNSLERDIAGARAAGVRSVWIELPEAHEERAVLPDFTITKMEELLPILDR